MPPKKGKKGQLDMLKSVIMTLVIVGFLLVIGLALMGGTRPQACTADGNYYNETAFRCQVSATNMTGASGTVYTGLTTTVGAMDDIPGWLPVIVLSFIALIVLSVVFMLNKRM